MVTPFVSYHQDGIVNNCTKFCVNPTDLCGDIKYLNLKSGNRPSWGSSKM